MTADGRTEGIVEEKTRALPEVCCIVKFD